MTVGRDIPSVLFGAQDEYKHLYESDPRAALKLPVTLQSGFGQLKMGTALAVNTSSSSTNYNKTIPYDQSAKTGAEASADARAYIVQDGAGTTSVSVTIDDSYKFIVGDEIQAIDADTTSADLGAITDIDRTTYPTRAVITTTNALSSDYTTANFAYVALKGSDACVGILEKSVNTGTGANAQGAIATMVLGNAIFRSGMLTNVDSAARTDLSASTYGAFTYMK
jgi:hypothetical protein